MSLRQEEGMSLKIILAALALVRVTAAALG